MAAATDPPENRQRPGSRGGKRPRSHWPGCSRLYRFRADSWAGARPRGIRWRTRERHHGCGPSLARAWHADALRACSSPHGSASTVGACPGRRARGRWPRTPRPRAERSRAGLARLGVAASARRTCRVVVARCAPLASQLVAASASLSSLRHLGTGRPWRSIRDDLRGDDE